jgi:trans-aconitate methyltransferase
MLPKHKQWSAEYASIFADMSVVEAYRHRPPYPQQTFAILEGLIPGAAPRAALDAGCGTGFVARPLAQYIDRLDAVDVSEAMIAAGTRLPGGDDPRLRWICGPIETAVVSPPYGLIVAAASLHWMEWDVVLPRFASWLAPQCYLAIVEDVALPNRWDAEVGPVLRHYSMNKDFQPYTMLTIAAELERRGLFQQVGVQTTDFMPFHQSIAGWVESLHARNGFSRDRMDPGAAAECDRKLAGIIARHCPTGIVEQQIAGRVIWGKPQMANASLFKPKD